MKPRSRVPGRLAPRALADRRDGHNQLFIGVGMVSTVSEMRTWLIDLHQPLRILILCLAALRVCLRLTHPAPPLPDVLPAWRRRRPCLHTWCSSPDVRAAPGRLDDAVGGGYPIALFGSPPAPIGAVDPTLFALPPPSTHTLLALLLFLAILADPRRCPVPCLDSP